MQIKLFFFGVLKNYFGSEPIFYEVKEGFAVSDILPQIFYEKKLRYEDWSSIILLAINQKHVEANTIIKANDELAVMPPLAGG